MAFWDRFILHVYLAMMDTLPTGRDAVAHLFELAYQRNRFVPSGLNDLSILLLLAACQQGPLRTLAEQEAGRRNFVRQAEHLWELLRLTTSPPLREVLEMGRAPVPATRAILAALLSHPVLTAVQFNLCLFLGRSLLVDPVSCRLQALQLSVEATNLYYHIPAGTIDYLVRLYRRVLFHLRTQEQALPSVFPPGPRPAWYTALAPEERDLIDRGLAWLSEPDLLLLYLHFYARLTAETIAQVRQQEDESWTAERVLVQLERCWRVVLDDSEGPPG